jgi:tetratricopeptide (TPR) repeat protein
MNSLAQRHWQRQNAQQKETPGVTRVNRLLQAKLATDRQRLKAIQSRERKIAVKRELLPSYTDYIDGVLHSGRGESDEILTTLMVWHIDVGEFERALTIAAYALRFGLRLPEHYARTLPTLLVEEIAEATLKQNVSGEILAYLESLTAHYDMPDPVRAKLYKALGIVHQINDPPQAQSYFDRALTLHPACGVKQLIRRLERQSAPLGQATPTKEVDALTLPAEVGSSPVSA